jgi:hypothetical protein
LLLSSIGEEGSFSHGSVIDGRFEGFIKTRGGTFYIEPAERYIKDRILPFHSVIYHEDDISKYSCFILGSLCKGIGILITVWRQM